MPFLKITEITGTFFFKSPGIDGFTVECYKFFWNDIKILLVKCLNESLDNGKFSVSQRQGLITCIPKEGKSKAFSKSINSKRPGISSSSNLSIKSYISLVHSPIYLLFKNPFCVSLIIFLSIGFILFTIQADVEKTLQFYGFGPSLQNG
jgi:hypothetical protein